MPYIRANLALNNMEVILTAAECYAREGGTENLAEAARLYNLLRDHRIENNVHVTFANADVAEFTVPEGAKITKHLIKDLGLPKGTTIGGMIRNGEGILVTGDTQIRPGDHVVVFCLSMMIKKIEKFFN